MGRKSTAKAERRASAGALPAPRLTAHASTPWVPTQQEALDEITRLDQLHKSTRRDLSAAVIRARDLNVSWTVIGTALGVSRQAARRRFEAVTSD